MSHLIKNGLLIDGSGRPGFKADLRIAGGMISEIGPDLPGQGENIVDAAGQLVMPGLIDLHAHVFSGMGIWSINPEEAGLRTGVTTLLDAGSAGALTYPTFHRFIIERAAESIFALVNISLSGCLLGHSSVTPWMGELSDRRHLDVSLAVAIINKYRDRLVGTKARLSRELADDLVENERAALQGAIAAAEQTGTFCMLHHASSQLSVAEVISTMRPGDVYTHLYHPEAGGPFSQGDGRPEDCMLEGRERGVLFDVGHGGGAFSWAVAEAACLNHGFWPDVISTDIHQFNIDGPVWDLPTTMSKFLHLGMPIENVVYAATGAPAKALRMSDRFGLLQVGRPADIAVMDLKEGAWDLPDVQGEIRKVSRRLKAKTVFKNGSLYAESRSPSGSDKET